MPALGMKDSRRTLPEGSWESPGVDPAPLQLQLTRNPWGTNTGTAPETAGANRNWNWAPAKPPCSCGNPQQGNLGASLQHRSQISPDPFLPWSFQDLRDCIVSLPGFKEPRLGQICCLCNSWMSGVHGCLQRNCISHQQQIWLSSCPTLTHPTPILGLDWGFYVQQQLPPLCRFSIQGEEFSTSQRTAQTPDDLPGPNPTLGGHFKRWPVSSRDSWGSMEFSFSF